MDSERLAYLLEQRRKDAETAEERLELQTYLEESGDEAAIRSLFRELYEQQPTTVDMTAASRNAMLEAIFESDRQGRPARKPVRRIWYWSVAAAVLAIVAGVYLIYSRPPAKEIVIKTSTTPVIKQDVDPGTNKAVLTLGDGKRIDLDSSGSGQIANENGVKIFKSDNGKLAYQGGSEKTLYNTLATPRGGQYQLALPDGTKVWLNAASSIKYPTVFREDTRELEISGEVYFEVAQDAKHPFQVRTGNMVVDVLGTSFDVMAYPDEGGVRTTLSEGKVRVRSGAATAVLVKGEQARLNGEEGFSVKRVDLDIVLGWKNGLFKFERASLQEVLRQFSRWYDIEVIYEGEPKELKFAGGMGRDLQLSQALYGLANMGVRYRLEGKKLIIM